MQSREGADLVGGAAHARARWARACEKARKRDRRYVYRRAMYRETQERQRNKEVWDGAASATSERRNEAKKRQRRAVPDGEIEQAARSARRAGRGGLAQDARHKGVWIR